MTSFFPSSEASNRGLKLNRKALGSTQPYNPPTLPDPHASTSSFSTISDFPAIPKNGKESFRDRIHKTQAPNTPSSQPASAAAAPAQPLPARSDSLMRHSAVLHGTRNNDSVIPENAVKAFSPKLQPTSPVGPPPQAGQHNMTSRSLSTSTRSSHPEPFGSPSSHLSARSSNSSFNGEVPSRKPTLNSTHHLQQESGPANKLLPKRPSPPGSVPQPPAEDPATTLVGVGVSGLDPGQQPSGPMADSNIAESLLGEDDDEEEIRTSTSQNQAVHNMNRSNMPSRQTMDFAAKTLGEDFFEEEPSAADQIILEIMSHLKRIPDLVAAAQVNTGFYGVFCDHGQKLIKAIILDTMPAAWEYMETSNGTLSHPSFYLQSYHQSQNVLSDLKNIMFLQCESTLRPETMDGLMGVNVEKIHQIDSALWRIWTFCEIFGGDSGHETDVKSQTAWLDGAKSGLASTQHPSFGAGNGSGLSATELLLMAELWNALSTLLQKSFQLPVEAHRNSFFAKTDTQYPKELYLLEWISYVMTLGLGSVRMLASGSFEEAENLGLAHWSPPRQFGRRQAFLKGAVASTYRRRLQEEAAAKASKAGAPVRATHRALAPTRRIIQSPAGAQHQAGVMRQRSVESGERTDVRSSPQSSSRWPPGHFNPPHDAIPSVPEHAPESPPLRAPGHNLSQSRNNARPPIRTAQMVSYLSSQPQATASIGATLFPYETPCETPMEIPGSPALSAISSQPSRPPRDPFSSPPLLPSPGSQPAHSQQQHIVDPVDSALALLVDEMGFPATAARRALAASDDGSGLNADKAIALLQADIAAASEKIPVEPENAKKPAKRFAGLKAKFSSQPMPAGRTFGELRPTGKERRQYGGLSAIEQQELKKDVFRAKAYKEAFGDLFHGRLAEFADDKSAKDSVSTISGPEAGGGSLSPVGSRSSRNVRVGSASIKRKESSSTDARSVKS